jgi:hypothetical protein
MIKVLAMDSYTKSTSNKRKKKDTLNFTKNTKKLLHIKAHVLGNEKTAPTE